MRLRSIAPRGALLEKMRLRSIAPRGDFPEKMRLWSTCCLDSSSGEHGTHVIDEAFMATEEDMASDEAMWALYERWCEDFKEEREHDEMVRLFPNFKKSVLRVHEVNNSNLPFKLEISVYADRKYLANARSLTEQDFARYKAQGLLDESHYLD